MRIFRIAVVVIFVICLALNVVTTLRYEAEHDTEGPKLSCDSDYLEISVTSGEEAMLAGVTAEDAQDGDLTDRILLSSTSYFLDKGTFNATYVVFDSHHNSATLTRRIHYTDYTAPRFGLTAPLVFVRGSTIRFLNYVTVTDCLDGDISDSVKVLASNVSNYTAGTYPVLLEVTNSHGDQAQVELNVVVLETRQTGPQILLSEYLTYVEQGSAFDPYSLILSVEGTGAVELSKNDVSVYGTVDVEEPGCYQLIYSCTNGTQEGKTYLTVVVTEGDA